MHISYSMPSIPVANFRSLLYTHYLRRPNPRIFSLNYISRTILLQQSSIHNFVKKRCRHFGVPRKLLLKSSGLLFCTVPDFMIAWGAISWRLISVSYTASCFSPINKADIAGNAVRNWEFLLSGVSLPSFDGEPDPRSMLRRRSSLVIADLPPSIHSIGRSHNKGPATVFVEPEASSILDSFGF